MTAAPHKPIATLPEQENPRAPSDSSIDGGRFYDRHPGDDG
jgi:hypothetical protein